MRSAWKRWGAAACVFAAAAELATAGVTVLGKPQLGVFTTIQGAVDAAADEDVLLVEPGTYTSFVIDDKTLTVLATSGGLVTVNGTTRVRNLGALRSVTLVGMRLFAVDNSYANLVGLELTDDTGPVHVQSCETKGSRYTSSFNWQVGAGASATNCLKVVFTQCTLTGRDHGFNSGYSPVAGGDGLTSVDSSVALYDCTLKGGRGSDESYPAGGKGGAGCRATNFGVYVSGTTLRGGNGGGGDYIGCTAAGDGGDALVLNGAQAQLLSPTLTPGLGNGYYSCTPGNDGVAIVSNGGVVNNLTGVRRKLTGPAETFDNSTMNLTITGRPGDRVWLMRGKKPAFLYQAAMHGVLAVSKPPQAQVEFLGTIGATGSLVVPYAIGDVLAPADGWMWHMQVLCYDASRNQYLSGPLHTLVRDS